MTEPTGADEPRLALAERADLVPGWPQWIGPALRLSRGLDPLGLQTITLDRIMPSLLPGVLVLSQRARLFSLYPFLVAEYQRLGGATTNTALSAFTSRVASGSGSRASGWSTRSVPPASACPESRCPRSRPTANRR
jgi:hypothetical protein